MSEQLVYVIRGTTTGLVKVGTSEDPERRLATLQAGSPDELVLIGTCPGGPRLERMLHGWLADDRRHGEWFAPSVRTWAVVGAVVMGDLGPLELEAPSASATDIKALAERLGVTVGRARTMAQEMGIDVA